MMYERIIRPNSLSIHSNGQTLHVFIMYKFTKLLSELTNFAPISKK